MLRDLWMRLPPLARAVIPGLLLTLVGALAFASVLEEVISRDAFEGVDQPMIEWLADNRVGWLTAVMTAITQTFGPVVLPILILLGCGLWWWRTRSWRDPLLLAGAMVFSTLATQLVKMIVARARPGEGFQSVPGYESSYSFPSGHTTGAATLVLVTAFLIWHRKGGVRAALWWAIGSVLVIAVVGGTRLYLGYHFLSDVIAGACMGVIVLGIIIAIDRWLDLRDATRASAVESPAAH